MQDEIAVAIADTLKVTLASGNRVLQKHQPSVPAYEAYLRYRHHQWGLTPESLQMSRQWLEEAVRLDPLFAPPFVGLADFSLASAVVGAIPAHEAMPRARELARRALELDPDLPETGQGHAAGWPMLRKTLRLPDA